MAKVPKHETRPLSEVVADQPKSPDVDTRQVLSKAEYKARISKLKISFEVDAFRKKYKRGEH